MFIEAKDDGSGGDNWSYKSCKAPVKFIHQQTNIQFFYRPDALPVARPTVSKHCRKSITFHHITPGSPGGFPTLPLTTDSSWLPWGRVAMPLISPLIPVPHVGMLFI